MPSRDCNEMNQSIYRKDEITFLFVCQGLWG